MFSVPANISLMGHLGRLVVVRPKCEAHLVAAEHLGQHHGCDAHGHDRLLGAVGLENGIGHRVYHRHAGPVEGEGGEVACGTHAAGEREGVVVIGAVLFEREQVAAGDTCAYDKDVALLGIHQGALLLFVVHDVDMGHHLEVSLRCEALVLPAAAVDGEHERETLLQLATVAVAAAAEDYCYLLHTIGDFRPQPP